MSASPKPLTVADLNEEHVGFYMQIEVDQAEGQFGPPRLAIELGGIRRWEYPEGTPRTGLLDVSTKAPGIAGTERQFRHDARVTLIRQVRKPRKPRKSRKSRIGDGR